jgi:type III secretion protein T
VNATGILPSVELIYQYLLAAGFALSRILGMMVVLPSFTRLGVTTVVRNGIALAFALPLVPMLVGALAASHLTLATIGALLFKETAVGVLVGLVLGVPLWAAEAAGDIVDLQRGASFTAIFDPQATGETSVAGTLLGLAMVAVFYGSGGLFVTLRTLYGSYGVWPIDRFLPLFGPDAAGLFLRLLDDVVTMGLMLVAPIVICLFLADILLALVSRAAPHFNVFALSLAVKNLLFAILMVLYGSFLAGYMGTDLGALLGATERLMTIGDVKLR